MKTTLVLLGSLAAVLAPLSAHADPESVRAGAPAAPAGKRARTVASDRSDRATIYITSRTATGSHLPLAVRRYRGEYTSMSPGTVYGRPDLDRTGQLSVAGELYQRDPAISSVSGRH